MGSIGLIAFAIMVWQGLRQWPLTAVLAASIVAWLLVAVAVWWIRKTWLRKLHLTRGRK